MTAVRDIEDDVREEIVESVRGWLRPDHRPLISSEPDLRDVLEVRLADIDGGTGLSVDDALALVAHLLIERFGPPVQLVEVATSNPAAAVPKAVEVAPPALASGVLEVARAATMAVRSSETGRVEFSPAMGGQFLRENVRLATDGERIYIANETGQFVPNARAVASIFAELRGDLWRASHAREVIAWLVINAPLLTMPPPNVLPLRGCVLELPGGQMRAYRDDERWPVQMAFAYNAGAAAPQFERWLEEMQPDPAVRMRLLQFIGLAMTTEMRHHKMQLWVGNGSNGKSVLADIAQALIGVENTAEVSLHAIGEDTFALADLQGKTLCLTGEVEDRELTTTAVLKKIVRGEGTDDAQRKHGQRFKLVPKCKVLAMANALPMTADASHGFYRSIDIVKWDRQIAAEDQDRFLTRRLIATELEGIGRLCIGALLRLELDGDFNAAPAIDSANVAYRESSDAVTAFLTECVEVVKGATVPRTSLYGAYRPWAEDQGRNPLGAAKFNERVAARLGPQGVALKKRKGIWTWVGCSISADAAFGGLR